MKAFQGAVLGAVTRFSKSLDVICQSPHQRSLSSPPPHPPRWSALSCVLSQNGGVVAMDTGASKGQYQVFLIRLETGYWQASWFAVALTAMSHNAIY